MFSHPPEVFPVGLFGNIVFGVDLSLQGAKASPLRDVFFAEHTRNLKDRSMTSLDFTISKLFTVYVLQAAFLCNGSFVMLTQTALEPG